MPTDAPDANMVLIEARLAVLLTADSSLAGTHSGAVRTYYMDTVDATDDVTIAVYLLTHSDLPAGFGCNERTYVGEVQILIHEPVDADPEPIRRRLRNLGEGLICAALNAIAFDPSVTPAYNDLTTTGAPAYGRARQVLQEARIPFEVTADVP